MNTISFEEGLRLVTKTKEAVQAVIIGKNEAIELALAAFLAKGHLLLEDLPGTGKTTLAKALARCLGCEFKRIQFTPDLMPSDVTGINYFNVKSSEFEFRPGPILTNILLADEINRATPRTQSALLEAMEEKQVTIDGATHRLEQPFLVLATQNPVETEGTFPLPIAQQDRFLIKINLGYPARLDEVEILKKHAFGSVIDTLEPVLDSPLACQLQGVAETVHLEDALVEYTLDLIEATRQHPAVELALSTRATISMVRASKALAFLRGRDYVLPDDLKALCIPVFAHRIRLKKAEKYKGLTAEDFLGQVMDKIAVPTQRQK